MKRPIVIVLLIVALLLVAAGIGAVAFFTLGSREISFGSNLVSASAEESKSLNVDGPVTLKVTDDAGSVTIIGADVEKVEVKAIKTSHAPTQARAEEELKDIKYEIRQDGNIISLTYNVPRIKTNMPNVFAISDNWETVDFVITVPFETRVDVTANVGEVNVSNIKGNTNIANSFGDVIIENVDGKLKVDTKSGQVDVTSVNAGKADITLTSGFGALTLEKASGANITASSNSGAVNAENVTGSGQVELSSDFGNVEFKRGSAGSLVLRTKSGAVTLTSVNIAGALEIKNDFGDLNLNTVKADSYDAQTNSGSITMDGVQGIVRAHTGFGSITIRNAENATLDLSTQSGSIDFDGSLGEGPHLVHSDFGSIEMSLPADSALNVDLSTEFGQITSDIPFTVTLTGDLKDGQQSGTINGGGSSLTVSTKSGGIRIKAMGE